MPLVSVFGSGVMTADSADYQSAEAVGAALAKANYRVATGGYGGAMEAVSKGVNRAQGNVIGVTCQEFHSKANAFLTEEISAKTFKDRIFQLITMADAYVILPGGMGTLCEIAVSWEMSRKHLMKEKPLLFYGNYWKQRLEAMMHDFADGVILRSVQTPEEMINCLKEYDFESH